MTLVDPPKVVSPDVSQFLSTPDPAELAAAEIPETDEPLGPWVSRMPVRPPQHPNRRKLSDEFEKHIGDGDPEASPAPENAHLTVSQNEIPPTQREHSDRRDHNDRRDRRDRRDRGDRRDGRDRRDRGARMDGQDSRQTDSAEPGPSAPAAEQANTSQSAHSGAHRQPTGFAPISRTEANNANGAGDQIVGIADLAPIAIPDDLHNETRPIMTPPPASSPLKTLATALTKNCQRTLR